MSTCRYASGGREESALGWRGRLLIGQAPVLLENRRSLTSAPPTRLYVVCTSQMSRHMHQRDFLRIPRVGMVCQTDWQQAYCQLLSLLMRTGDGCRRARSKRPRQDRKLFVLTLTQIYEGPETATLSRSSALCTCSGTVSRTHRSSPAYPLPHQPLQQTLNDMIFDCSG